MAITSVGSVNLSRISDIAATSFVSADSVGGVTVDLHVPTSSTATELSGAEGSDPLGRVATCQLDDTTHVVVYYPDSTYQNAARVITRSGTSLSAGALLEYNGFQSTGGFNQIVAMDSTHVIVPYGDSFATGLLARCLTKSGTTLTAGAEASLDTSTGAGSAAVCSLSSTSGIIAYSNGSTVKAIPITLSGTTVTAAGSAVTIATGLAVASVSSIATMSSSTAITVYRDLNADTIKAVGLSLSGSTLSAGTPVTLADTYITSVFPKVCSMDSTYALAHYVPNPSQTGPRHRIDCLSLSGTAITVESTTDISSDRWYDYPSLCSVSATKAFVVNSSSAASEVIELTLSGTTVYTGYPTAYRAPSSSARNRSISPVSATSALVAEVDWTDKSIEGALIYLAPEVIVPTPAWDGGSGGLPNGGIRQLIPAASISADASSVTVKFVAHNITGGADVLNVYIGHQASSGDAWDFDGTQVEMLFSSSSGFSIAAGTSIVSDPVIYSVDSSKNLIVAVGYNGNAADDNFRTASAAGYAVNYKVGGASETGTTDVSGYTSVSGLIWLVGEVTKIS